jgi:CHAT domain-containing protein
MLSEIPIRALVDPKGRYLGDLYSVVLSPGLIYEQRLAPGSAISNQDSAFVIGSPATAASEERVQLNSLADATREAEVVAGKFREATFLRGKEASLNAVDRYLGNADVFHFAGHAVTSPGGVALVLAIEAKAGHTGRSLLNADYLGERKLKCRLVVLSACATGQGEDGSLAAPESLVRGFLRAGVPHVVASHWNVNSATTASFMSLFYSALLSGSPVPVALKRAAQEIHSQAATVHPYYWAAFEAYGRM